MESSPAVPNRGYTMDKVVDNLDGVPELYRGFYEKRADGKFELQDISGLRSALSNVRRERDEHKTKAQLVASWEKIGKTPEEIEQLLAAEADRTKKKHEEAGEWDKLREQMNTAHATALMTKDKEIQRLTEALNEALVVGEASRVLAEEKGSTTLLLPHIQRNVRVVEKDGKFIPVVVDKDGNSRVDGQGLPLSIKALVAEMKKSDEFSRAFDGTGQSGGGAPPGGRPPGGAPPAGGKNRSKMTVPEKAAYIKEHGQVAFLQLPH